MLLLSHPHDKAGTVYNVYEVLTQMTETSDSDDRRKAKVSEAGRKNTAPERAIAEDEKTI